MPEISGLVPQFKVGIWGHSAIGWHGHSFGPCVIMFGQLSGRSYKGGTLRGPYEANLISMIRPAKAQ